MHAERVFKTIRKANRLNQVQGMVLGPLQILMLTLRADATAKVIGRSVLQDRPALGMDFPNAPAVLPGGIAASRMQIWIGEKDSLPLRARLFTQRQGVLTFDITYAARKDAHGLEYCLPDVVALQPAVAEDQPSAAFPMRLYFANYAINVEVPDAAHE